MHTHVHMCSHMWEHIYVYVRAVDMFICACGLSSSIVLHFICWSRDSWTWTSPIPASLALSSDTLSHLPRDGIIGSLCAYLPRVFLGSESQSSHLGDKCLIHWTISTVPVAILSTGKCQADIQRLETQWNTYKGQEPFRETEMQGSWAPVSCYNFPSFKFKSARRPSDLEAALR